MGHFEVTHGNSVPSTTAVRYLYNIIRILIYMDLFWPTRRAVIVHLDYEFLAHKHLMSILLVAFSFTCVLRVLYLS